MAAIDFIKTALGTLNSTDYSNILQYFLDSLTLLSVKQYKFKFKLC